MRPLMTLLILSLLSPCAVPSTHGAGSLPAGERVSALVAALVADQGMVLTARDPDDLASDAGEESTDDEVGPPSHLASRLAHEFWLTRERVRSSNGFVLATLSLVADENGRVVGDIALSLKIASRFSAI